MGMERSATVAIYSNRTSCSNTTLSATSVDSSKGLKNLTYEKEESRIRLHPLARRAIACCEFVNSGHKKQTRYTDDEHRLPDCEREFCMCGGGSEDKDHEDNDGQDVVDQSESLDVGLGFGIAVARVRRFGADDNTSDGYTQETNS